MKQKNTPDKVSRALLIHVHKIYAYLLTSRLYCRFRNHTGSAAVRRSRTFQTILTGLESPSVGNLCLHISPCPEDFLFNLQSQCNAFFCSCQYAYFSNFMVSCILCFFKSTLMTFTSTTSPTLTTSSGCLT